MAYIERLLKRVALSIVTRIPNGGHNVSAAIDRAADGLYCLFAALLSLELSSKEGNKIQIQLPGRVIIWAWPVTEGQRGVRG